MEHDDNSAASTPSVRQQRIKKRKQTACKRYTPAGVCVFEGNKHDWSIEPQEHTTTIVIGDSNLKNVNNIPKDWEVHSLPGARLSHAVGAISRLETINQPVSVVVHIGINHRNRVDVTTDEELKDIMAELQINSAICKLFFAGTSIPTTLPNDEALNILALNDKVKSFVHESNYIPPLDDKDVEVREDDPFGIHYTTRTANNIMANIVKHVSASVFC
jgi:hypothetical protein